MYLPNLFLSFLCYVWALNKKCTSSSASNIFFARLFAFSLDYIYSKKSGSNLQLRQCNSHKPAVTVTPTRRHHNYLNCQNNLFKFAFQTTIRSVTTKAI